MGGKERGCFGENGGGDVLLWFLQDIGEATFRVLCAVLVTLLKEICCSAGKGECP